MIKRHFEVLTTSRDFETNEILYRELGGEATGYDCHFSAPNLPHDKQTLDETEAAMLARFVNPPPDDKGWDEFAQTVNTATFSRSRRRTRRASLATIITPARSICRSAT